MRELSKEEVKIFKNKGVLIIDDYISLDLCRSIIADIKRFDDNEKMIFVNNKKRIGRFKTLNGKTLIKASQTCLMLRDKTLELIKKYLDDKIVNILSMKIGVSANIMSVGDNFKKHYDRNKITAVIYWNQCDGEGEMLCYPRCRFLLPGRYLFGLRHLQIFLDRIVLNSFYQKYFVRKFIIAPKPGRVVFFEGNRTLHGVQPLHKKSSVRYSIQLAYDLCEDMFGENKTTNYYGN